MVPFVLGDFKTNSTMSTEVRLAFFKSISPDVPRVGYKCRENEIENQSKI